MPFDDYAEEMRRLSKRLEGGLDMLYEQSREWASAEAKYKKAYAVAITRAEGTVQEKDAEAQLATITEYHHYLMAERMTAAAKEAVRSRRTQISALQSLLNAEKEEAAFARTGPQ